LRGGHATTMSKGSRWGRSSYGPIRGTILKWFSMEGLGLEKRIRCFEWCTKLLEPQSSFSIWPKSCSHSLYTITLQSGKQSSSRCLLIPFRQTQSCLLWILQKITRFNRIKNYSLCIGYNIRSQYSCTSATVGILCFLQTQDQMSRSCSHNIITTSVILMSTTLFFFSIASYYIGNTLRGGESGLTSTLYGPMDAPPSSIQGDVGITSSGISGRTIQIPFWIFLLGFCSV